MYMSKNCSNLVSVVSNIFLATTVIAARNLVMHLSDSLCSKRVRTTALLCVELKRISNDEKKLAWEVKRLREFEQLLITQH